MDMYSSVQALLDASPILPNDPILHDILYNNAGIESSQQRATIAELLDHRERHLRSLADGERRFVEATGLIRKEILKMDAQCDILRKAIASPIRALPVDILREIFYLCVEPTALDPPFDYAVPPHMQSLLRLSYICRWWRRIVHDMPTLWQCLLLTLRSIVHPNAKFCIAQWPVHSSELPLSYIICGDPEDYPLGYSSNEKDRAKALFSCRVSELMRDAHLFPSHRLQSLYVLLPASQLVPALSHLPPRAFPRLEDLQLYLPKEYSRETSRVLPLTSPVHAFEDATLLSALHLIMVVDDTLSEHLRLPWSSLTDLTLNLDGPSSAVIAILQLCPRLVHLHIDERCLDFPPNTHHGMLWTTPAAPVVMDDLRSLSFVETSTCITSLRAPNLSFLELHGVCWHQARPPLAAFLQRACNLTSLTLVECDFMGLDVECLPMAPMWQLLSRVEELVLEDCDLNILMLVDDLTIRPGDTPILPRLEVLRITAIRGCAPSAPDAMVDKVAAMIESRMRPRPGISPIRRVELWPLEEDTFPPNFAPRVQSILGDGVELALP